MEKTERNPVKKALRDLYDFALKLVEEQQALQRKAVEGFEARPETLKPALKALIIQEIESQLAGGPELERMAATTNDETKATVQKHLAWSAEALSRIKAINATHPTSN